MAQGYRSNSSPIKLSFMACSKTPSTKPQWRRWAKGIRGQPAPPGLSEAVVEQLEGWPPYRRAEHVLTYLAFGSELDLSGLTGKHFYTTKTHKDGSLSVHALRGGLERHPYGFYEPVAGSQEVELGRLELLLVPGLAFDVAGNRLGYGGGFYDRLLARVGPGVPRVGVTRSDLIVPALPARGHDVSMTHLLSETGVLEL